MEAITAIGYLAAVCSTTSFAPQAWKIIRTRDAGAISTRMYVITVIGFVLWFVYGVGKVEWPIILTNGICFLLSGFILIMKMLPPRARDEVAHKLDVTESG
jgi:MtN3 and saliva related transmembrane protein